jgi:hypothetical protein
LRYFCSPQHTDSAFYPIIGQMERAAGLAHDDTPQARLDKLDAVLARTSTSTQNAALFAELLSMLRIPIQSGQGFRFDVGRRSDLMSATIPK